MVQIIVCRSDLVIKLWLLKVINFVFFTQTQYTIIFHSLSQQAKGAIINLCYFNWSLSLVKGGA